MPRRRVFPVQGQASFTNDWGGVRSKEATGGTGQHQGNDIFAPRGTPVVAVENGTITKMGPSRIGGNRIWLNGTWYYAHLDKFAKGLRVGSKVKAGQVIGYVGNTGDAQGTDPHLHFGHSPDGSQGANWANPYDLLTAWQKGDDVAPAETTAVPVEAPVEPQAQEQADESTPRFRYAQGVTTPVSPPLALPPLAQLPGTASPEVLNQPAAPAETWRRLSQLPLASPETQRLTELAGAAEGA